MGFHSSNPQQLFYNNITNSKGIHHRSVNEGIDTSNIKKRKHGQGRVSPSPFLRHHQHQPSAVIKVKSKRTPNTNSQKRGLTSKTRPQSATLKK